MQKSERCAWPRCRQRSDVDGVVVLGKFLCNKHWKQYAGMPTEEGRKKIGLPPPSPGYVEEVSGDPRVEVIVADVEEV